MDFNTLKHKIEIVFKNSIVFDSQNNSTE